jgi:2-polyprenyl-6-methoxyphenol hydroxylase-like FAD-dependent oxidoreductase
MPLPPRGQRGKRALFMTDCQYFQGDRAMCNSPRNPHPIVIAGGGIGGLACALALAQRNFAVIVCEKSMAFGQFGVGLHLAPNGLSALDKLGIGGRVKRNALLLKRMMMMDAVSCAQVCDIPCGAEFRCRFGNPYAIAHRAEVHDALLRECRSANSRIALRANSHVVDFSTRGSDVSVILADGQRIRASALIGADGIRSRVRASLVGDGEPHATGGATYHVLLPASAMPDTERKPFVTLWVGPGADLVCYPVLDGSVFNVAATVGKVTNQAADREATIEEVLAYFDGWAETPRRIIAAAPHFRRHIIRSRDPIDNWSEGSVTLIGDAAHPMVRYAAQSASMLLEDAICLAEQADATDGDFAAAFQAYQRVRMASAARAQLSSQMLERIYHAGGAARLARNAMFQRRTLTDHYDQMSWVFADPRQARATPPLYRQLALPPLSQ